MGKVLVLNMKDIKFDGDILDVSTDNAGVIYSISKEVEEELSIDYIDEEDKLEKKKYDVCTFFFNINALWTPWRKDNLIKKVTSSLKDNGRIYLWDMSKNRGEIIDYKVKVILPHNKIKEVSFKNLNPLATCNFEEIQKILSKYYIIQEEKQWEDVFFISAVKKNDINRGEKIYENITYSN